MNPSDNFIPLQDGAAYTSSSEQEMACAPGLVHGALQALTAMMGYHRPHHLLLQGRMLLFSLISEGCLMHILACSFNKHVIRLLPKLSTTDTSPRRGWQNSVHPRHSSLRALHYTTQRWSDVTARNTRLVRSEGRQRRSPINLRAAVTFWSFQSLAQVHVFLQKTKWRRGHPGANVT